MEGFTRKVLLLVERPAIIPITSSITQVSKNWSLGLHLRSLADVILCGLQPHSHSLSLCIFRLNWVINYARLLHVFRKYGTQS
jgi:hypothetical protein